MLFIIEGNSSHQDRKLNQGHHHVDLKLQARTEVEGQLEFYRFHRGERELLDARVGNQYKRF